MTVQEAITYACAVKPNAFDNDTLTRWLNEVEGMVQTQVLLLRVEAVITYTYAQDADTTMLVRPPHDKLYPAYLEARIDLSSIPRTSRRASTTPTASMRNIKTPLRCSTPFSMSSCAGMP